MICYVFELAPSQLLWKLSSVCWILRFISLPKWNVSLMVFFQFSSNLRKINLFAWNDIYFQVAWQKLFSQRFGELVQKMKNGNVQCWGIFPKQLRRNWLRKSTICLFWFTCDQPGWSPLNTGLCVNFIEQKRCKSVRLNFKCKKVLWVT